MDGQMTVEEVIEDVVREKREGYIVVVHYHYDATEPVDGDEPLRLHMKRSEAEARAAQFDGPSQSGEVWAIDVSGVTPAEKPAPRGEAENG